MGQRGGAWPPWLLRLCVHVEKQIKLFVPSEYWRIFTQMQAAGGLVGSAYHLLFLRYEVRGQEPSGNVYVRQG